MATHETLGYPVGWFSPSYRMLTEVWRAAEQVFQPITLRKSVQDHRIELVTGGVIEFWSLDNPDVARGRKYRRIVVDEAAMIPHLKDAWNYVLRPTLVDYAGDAYFLSTPKGFNFFWQMWQWGQDPATPEWASWKMPTMVNPLISATEIEAMRSSMPEVVFAQEILADFAEDASSIFKRDWWDVETKRNRFDLDDEGIERLVVARWLTIDTAFKDKVGNDYSACCVWELWPDYRLAVRHMWQERIESAFLPGKIEALSMRWNYDKKLRAVVIEDKGSGTTSIQTLRMSAPSWLAEIITEFQPTGTKEYRARLSSVWCERDCIQLPWPSGDWYTDFLDPEQGQLWMFPNAPHDDLVDSFTMGVLYLENFLSEGWHARQGKG